MTELPFSWEWSLYPGPIPRMGPSRKDPSGSSSFASSVRIYLCLWIVVNQFEGGLARSFPDREMPL